MEKAAEKQDEDIELLLGLARAYLEMKHLIRADRWATRAVRIDPENQEAKKILDLCL
jgi:Tfp pilus assembly protein PilF